jgi:hypothetical protein
MKGQQTVEENRLRCHVDIDGFKQSFVCFIAKVWGLEGY